jgi:hypothetical protein
MTKHKDEDSDRLDLESPLGLTDQPITRTPGDHLEGSTDPLSRRRRARALGEDGIEDPTQGLDDRNVDPDGAAGIDMGYGGEGTDIKPSSR